MVKHRKSNRRKQVWTNILLIVLTVAVLAVGGGAIWYYQAYLPGATAAMEASAKDFSASYFNYDYQSMTGLEGIDNVSGRFADYLRETANDRVDAFTQQQTVSEIIGDIQVQVLDRGWRQGVVRAEFMRIETDGDNVREQLEYYTYYFVEEAGDWVVDRLEVPSQEDLANFWRSRGFTPVDDEDDEDDEDGEGEDEEDNGSDEEDE
ncbi:MAG: hypothetical protein FH749_05770 [Firmicutes bacterium]|nr:hypothetical protein [Bacillota bacterium]